MGLLQSFTGAVAHWRDRYADTDSPLILLVPALGIEDDGTAVGQGIARYLHHSSARMVYTKGEQAHATQVKLARQLGLGRSRAVEVAFPLDQPKRFIRLAAEYLKDHPDHDLVIICTVNEAKQCLGGYVDPDIEPLLPQSGSIYCLTPEAEVARSVLVPIISLAA